MFTDDQKRFIYQHMANFPWYIDKETDAQRTASITKSYIDAKKMLVIVDGLMAKDK